MSSNSTTSSTEKHSGFHIRELEVNDYEKGFLECLKELTVVGNISKKLFEDTYLDRKMSGIITIVAVDNESQRILGTGSIFYEKKFIRKCALKAYIEDIVVSKGSQGKGIGKSIVKWLEDKGLSEGCYKVILTCNSENIPFYEKLKFKRIENAMAVYGPLKK